MILANAVLQWLPDHVLLMPRLIGKLADGGALARRFRTTWRSRRIG